MYNLFYKYLENTELDKNCLLFIYKNKQQSNFVVPSCQNHIKGDFYIDDIISCLVKKTEIFKISVGIIFKINYSLILCTLHGCPRIRIFVERRYI